MEVSSRITERHRYYLHCLCHEGKVDKVEAYLRTFDQLSTQLQAILYSREGVFGYTALHFAAINGHAAVLNFLLGKGVNPDLQSNDGSTPLHLAAKKGQVECVRYLVRFKADPFVKDKNGKTAKDLASLKLIQCCLRSAGQYVNQYT